jgi:hypothetical protein
MLGIKLANRAYHKAWSGEKLSRREKVFILGRVVNKTKLRKQIGRVTIDKDNNLSEVFCPKCGCYATDFIDMGVEYPEVWTKVYCSRCRKYLGGQDNSRPYHVLEDMIPEQEAAPAE